MKTSMDHSAGSAPGEETLVFESDWLSSRPFFYNPKTGFASPKINDVVDFANVEFDPEGFNDYLEFGFSAFGRTPIRDVRMLRHSSRLLSGPGGLRVVHLEDPTLRWFGRTSTVDEVLELASAKVNESAGTAHGAIVVPTSGGLDSRLIDVLVSDRSRVRAFTYGVSDDPARSAEAVKAAELARRLDLRWELIPLGWFHRYFDQWDELYGASTHAHGMYQIEFYHRILERVAAGSIVLSGACGEWFAGDPWPEGQGSLKSPDDVLQMFRYGRMSADSSMSNFSSARLGAQEFLEADPRLRTEYLARIIAMVRLRLTLLSYLVRVPESMGFASRAPFLDLELAMRMLTLPTEVRFDRRWEREFFARQGVDLEAQSFIVDYRNTLNFQAMRRVPLKPLDVSLLREVVKPDYVHWINRTVGPLGLLFEVMWRLGRIKGFGRAARALGQTGISNSRIQAYFAYLTLKPIESLLLRRNRARREEELR